MAQVASFARERSANDATRPNRTNSCNKKKVWKVVATIRSAKEGPNEIPFCLP